MENKRWIEISAEYHSTISNLEKMIQPSQTSTDLSNPFISAEQTQIFLRNQRIRSYLNNCREANKSLGIRKGEKVELNWLKRLSETERKIFVSYYEQKKSVSSIATEMQLDENRIKDYFNQAMKKVLQNIQEG